MNKNKWNSLSKDIQDAIMSVSGLEGSKFWGRNFFDAAKEDAIQTAQKGGFPIDVYMLPDEERARWVEISGKPLWEAWVKKMESKGYGNAREILDSTIELSKQ
jgi:TRAP-type C4-dicarboxylate transport system substrate-binding protein